MFLDAKITETEIESHWASNRGCVDKRHLCCLCVVFIVLSLSLVCLYVICIVLALSLLSLLYLLSLFIVCIVFVVFKYLFVYVFICFFAMFPRRRVFLLRIGCRSCLLLKNRGCRNSFLHRMVEYLFEVFVVNEPEVASEVCSEVGSKLCAEVVPRSF